MIDFGYKMAAVFKFLVLMDLEEQLEKVEELSKTSCTRLDRSW